MSIKTCPNCTQMITSVTKTCPHCSYELFDEVTDQFKSDRRTLIETNILRGGARYNDEAIREYDKPLDAPTKKEIKEQVDAYLSAIDSGNPSAEDSEEIKRYKKYWDKKESEETDEDEKGPWPE